MATERKIQQVQACVQTLEGGGFPVTRPFPVGGFREWDPFLLLDHFGPVEWQPGEAIGAPDHPHRGFETITYMLQGAMVHRDSKGHQAAMGPGDAQWMTAGSGVVHSEMPHPEFLRSGGWMEGFQLWVNLPAKDKMMHPAYHEIPAAKIPQVQLNQGWVKVIAGSYQDVIGPANPMMPIEYRHYHLLAGAQLQEKITEGLGLGLFIFKGEGLFGSEKKRVPATKWLAFSHEGSELWIENQGNEPLDLLWLAGNSLQEPIYRHGPFVMNSQQQLIEAVQDYQSGKMGSIAPTVD